MSRVVRAEWTKLRTVRSTGWSLLLLFGLTVGLGAFFAAGSETTGGGPGGGDNDLVRDSLVGVYLGQFAVVAFAVGAITSEYGTGLIRATFTAVPRRGSVLLAKVILVGGAVLAVGLLASTVAFVVGQELLRGSGYAPPGYPEWSLADEAARRAVVGSALLLCALALLSLGVGAIVRSSAVAITFLLGLLFVPLIFAAALPDSTRELLQQTTPGAGYAVQQTIDRPDALPIGPWVGLGVTFAWAAGALLLALWLIRRRDA